MITLWDCINRGEPDECWPWTGRLTNSGYPQMSESGERLAHRLIYTLTHGPIPAGHNVDHTCHNADATCRGGLTCLHRRCCNPAHLEAVTPLINTQRGNEQAGRGLAKTHCTHGHEYTPENTYWWVQKGRPARQCRACNRDRQAARRAMAYS